MTNNLERQAREDQQQSNDNASDVDSKSGGSSPSQTYAAPTEKPQSSYSNSYNKKKVTVVAPAPILVPVPGPPGLPGPPGPPGLPGLPGKTPNLRGLKAILLAKIAKLWLLAKAVAFLCLLKFGGNLGLILGLVLPLYAKLKKAGVVLPVHESYEEQPSYKTYEQQVSYAPQPAPAYGAPAPVPVASYGAPAPYSDQQVNAVHGQVAAAVDSYSAPPPPAPDAGYAAPPHRRRRR
jgi:hypothetical protein